MFTFGGFALPAISLVYGLSMKRKREGGGYESLSSEEKPDWQAEY